MAGAKTPRPAGPAGEAVGGSVTGSLRQVTIRGAFWLFLRFAGRQGANTVAFFTLAALLTPAEFGLGSIAVAIGMLLRIAVIRGFRDAVIQAPELTPQVRDTAWWLNIGLGLALAAGLAVMSPVLGGLIGLPGLVPLVLLAALIPAISAVSAIQEALIERAFRHRQLTFAQSIASASAAVLAIVFAANGLGAWAVVAYSVVEIAGVALVTAIVVRQLPGLAFDGDRARNQIRFAVPLISSAFLSGGFPRMVQVILGGLLGAAATAQFRVGLQVYQLLYQTVCAPLLQALLPAFSRVEDGHGERFGRAFSLVSAMAFPVFLGAAAISPVFIPAILGPQWQMAGTLAQILCLALLPLVLAQVLEPLLIARGATGRALLLAGLGVVAGLAAVSAGALGGDLVLATSAMIVRGLVTLVPAVWILREAFALPASRLAGLSLPYLGAAAIMYAAAIGGLALSVSVPPLLQVGVGVLMGGSVYLVLVRFGLKRLAPQAYQLLEASVPARVRRWL